MEEVRGNTGPRPGCRQELAPWATPPPYVLPLLEMRKPPGVPSVELTAGKSLPQWLFSNSQGPAVLAVPAWAPTPVPAAGGFLRAMGVGDGQRGTQASGLCLSDARGVLGKRDHKQDGVGCGVGATSLLFSSQKGGRSILGAAAALFCPGYPDSEVLPSA